MKRYENAQYISALDRQVELFALVTLAGLAHIASMFKTGVDWDAVFLALAVVLFLVPVLTFAGGTVHLKVQAKKKTKGQEATARQRGLSVFGPDKKTTTAGFSRRTSRISVVQHHGRHADEDEDEETGAMVDRDASIDRPSKENAVGTPIMVELHELGLVQTID